MWWDVFTIIFLFFQVKKPHFYLYIVTILLNTCCFVTSIAGLVVGITQDLGVKTSAKIIIDTQIAFCFISVLYCFTYLIVTTVYLFTFVGDAFGATPITPSSENS